VFSTFIDEVTTQPATRRLISACALVAAGFIDSLAGGDLAIVYAIPVVLAAALDGWGGGLTIAVLSSAGVFAFPSHQAIVAKVLDTLAFLVLAWLAVLTTGRERRLRHHYQQIAGQLSTVYEKVQANFEGMKRAERLSAIGQLSAGLAHEIRNPLASISGAAAILARSQDLEPKNAKCLEIITSECERLNGLLTNFLNFARPRPPRLQSVELEPVLENVLGLASHGVRGKTVRFEKRFEAGLQRVECDPEQLEQCWSDLQQMGLAASSAEPCVPVTYINSAASIKAFCGEHGGVVCTSSNAAATLKWAWERGERILFLPDQHLGRNTAHKMGVPLEQMVVWDPNEIWGGLEPDALQRARIILWKGHCSVHTRFTVRQIENIRAQHPGVRVIVHPEVPLDVVQAADDSGSTEYIIKTVKESPAAKAKTTKAPSSARVRKLGMVKLAMSQPAATANRSGKAIRTRNSASILKAP